jgi:Tfp pilus assembly protein PilE
VNRLQRTDPGDVVGVDSRREGFALVELAVVVVIIGLAAQIVIPRFLGHRTAVTDASAEALLRNAARDMEIAYSSTRDYTAITTVQLHAIDPVITFQTTPARSVDHQVQVTVSANGYSLDATGKSGSSFDYTKLLTNPPRVTRTFAAGGGANGSW